MRKIYINGTVYTVTNGNAEAFVEENGNYQECKCGEKGELAILGPSVMQGYFGEYSTETANVLKTHSDGSVWVHTGDIGFVDFDGRVHVTGRIKRMFVKHGYKVFASEVEACILRHPLVENCAVVAVPDEYKGFVEKAFVVLEQNNTENDIIRKELEDLCSKNLFDYEIPEWFVFVESLPHTGMGKIDYRVLEQMAK